jgi:catechol 2,3-dioxygenase-like lactoylglutathione lyase family enzyme
MNDRIAPARFGVDQQISDVCIVPEDIDASIVFYRDKLGFTLQHRMPGFADFAAPGVRLALWERWHLAETTGADDLPKSGGHGVIIAVRVATPDDVDGIYRDLVAREVNIISPPKDYPWNARCIYFTGPDNELWEVYSWFDGGEPGRVQ